MQLEDMVQNHQWNLVSFGGRGGPGYGSIERKKHDTGGFKNAAIFITSQLRFVAPEFAILNTLVIKEGNTKYTSSFLSAEGPRF